MTLSLKPTVRYMILCDDVLASDLSPGKPLIIGLVSLIHWPAQSTEPFVLPRLCVHAVLTDGYGKSQVRVSCFDNERNEEAWTTPEKTLSFEGKNPAGLHGVTFRIAGCKFKHPGVYTVRLLSDAEELDSCIITVR
jgi:hypothetical protein